MPGDENIFLALGKYVERQSENLLTQSLSVVVNHCAGFRYHFLKALRKRTRERDAVYAYATTQTSHRTATGRLIADMEVREQGTDALLYVVEAKLDADFSEAQARRYANHLKARRGGSRLVIVNTLGVDVRLLRHLPRSTVWITWTEIAEIAMLPRKATQTEKYLCKQFFHMLREKGVSMVPSIPYRSYQRLQGFNRFAVDSATANIHADTIEVANQALARIQDFAYASWEILKVEADYKRFTRVVVVREDGAERHVYLRAGYYRVGGGKDIRQRVLALDINCSDLSVEVVGHYILKRSHPEYDDPNWGYTVLHRWPHSLARTFFKLPLYDARARIRPVLEKCLKRYVSSRYYKAR